jgi:hypothetical protein
LKKQTQFIRSESCVLRTAGMELKKQSQFGREKNDVKLYAKGYYDKITRCGAQKNKPNLSLREHTKPIVDKRDGNICH